MGDEKGSVVGKVGTGIESREEEQRWEGKEKVHRKVVGKRGKGKGREGLKEKRRGGREGNKGCAGRRG